MKNLSKAEQIQRVNNLVNRIGYKHDQFGTSQADHWAAPSEFIYGRGDCEDYAILKFASLMALGHSNNDLRLVVGQLTGIGSHAFLSVDTGNGEV